MTSNRPPILAQRLIELTTTIDVAAAPDAPLAVRIAERASRSFGIVGRNELIGLGMSTAQVARWVRLGRLHRIHPRAYAVGHPSLSYVARVMAAQTSVGGDVAAAARCAAVLLGVYDRGRPVVEMTSTARHRGLQGAAMRYTRCLPDEDVIMLGPLRVTSVERTIVDLAEYLEPHQVAFALYEACRIRTTTLADVQQVASRHRSRHGSPTLARAIALYLMGSAGTRSPAEDEFLRLLMEAGLPEPHVNVHVHVGRRKYELDFHWPEILLNIEVDGGDHLLPARRRRDEERDARLRGAGWNVVRIPPSFLEAGVDVATRRFAMARA